MPSPSKLVFCFVTALAAAAAAGPASAAPAPKSPLEVKAVSPAVAARGELVTVEGAGFGGPNAVITVGGDVVQTLEGTGNRVRFRVPPLCPVGLVKVQVRNPGGHTAEIGLTVLFDGNVAVQVNASAGVSAPIGRDGGTLFAGGMSLSIPAGALSSEQLITMTPILGLSGSPFAGQVSGAVFAPDGLVLLKPATLSLELSNGILPGDVLGFGFDGVGEDLHLTPRVIANGRVELDVWHFSGAGGSFGRFVNGVAPWIPGSAETLALQEIAIAQVGCDLSGNPASQACSVNFPTTVRSELLRWYRDAVEPALRGALGAASFKVEDAYEEWLRWARQVRVAQEQIAILSTLEQKLTEAEGLARKALANLTKRRLDNCTGTDLPSQLRDVARMADLVVAGAIDLTLEDLPDVASLLDACAGIRIDTPVFPSVAARGAPNRFSVRTYIGTFTGAEETNVPLQVSLAIDRGDADSTSGTPDSQGRFQTNVFAFSDVSNISINTTVDLASNALPELPPLDRARFEKSLRITRNALDRLQVSGPSGPVQPGSSAGIAAQLAGDDISGRTIGARIVSGPGSLSSPTATTDSTGRAAFTFSAPSAGSGTTTLEVTLDDAGNLRAKQIQVSIAQAITVTVSPASATLAPGQTRQFTATVTGTTNTAVTWTASGGSIGSSGLYTAGSTNGSFSVIATSVADPTRSGAALVTISSVVRGVRREDSGGLVSAGHSTCSGFIESPAGVTAWSDTFTCPGADALGTSSTSFTETYSGSDLVAVTASGSGFARTSLQPGTSASGGGDYTLQFSVAQTTRVFISAQTTGGANSNLLFFFAGPGILIDERTGNPVNQTVTLTPGNNYVIAIAANAGADGNTGGSASVSFNLNLTFGP